MDGYGVAEVVDRPPSWSVVLRRGLRRRCPRCGDRDVFATRWRLRDRCPRCGYRFKREPGFSLGAWFLNFMVLETIHLAGAMGYIVWLSSNPGASLWPPLLVGAALAVTVPVYTYPHSQTTWAAIDLIMTPLELDEIVDALDATVPAGGGHHDGPGPEVEHDAGR